MIPQQRRLYMKPAQDILRYPMIRVQQQQKGTPYIWCRLGTWYIPLFRTAVLKHRIPSVGDADGFLSRPFFVRGWRLGVVDYIIWVDYYCCRAARPLSVIPEEV